jgi:itaconate CoA-transferase
LEALLEKADVLVQNLAPGAAARLGLSFEALHAKHKKLIVCDISGYGGDGPYRDKKAYDLLIQSEAGFLSVTGTADTPAKAGCSVADIAAGMYAYTNILAALIQRGQTGTGIQIDVSMLESMVEWMGFPLYYAFEEAPPPARAGAAHATIFPYGPFVAGDGVSVMLGLQNEREWASFCRIVLEQAGLASDHRFSSNSMRLANREVLTEMILESFGAMTSEEVVAKLEQAQIANARVNEMKDVWAHPQLQARQRWTQIQTPAGPVPALLPPGRSEAIVPRMGPVPALGEHTDAILAEFGWSCDEIQQLRIDSAV